MQGEEARRFTLIREHPEHTLHANVDGAGRDVGTVEVAAHGTGRQPHDYGPGEGSVWGIVWGTTTLYCYPLASFNVKIVSAARI